MLHTRDESLTHSGTTKYGYVPSLAAGAVFAAVFALLTLAHLALLVRSRIWWTVVIVIGGVGEVVGWAARLWASRLPASSNLFVAQIICLIMAPSFVSAGIYAGLCRLIRAAGPEHSLLGPTWYLWVFCTVDVISIMLQGAGGGLASGGDPKGPSVMLAGIIFQLVSMIAFLFLFCHFVRRARARSLPDSPSARLLHSRPVVTLVRFLFLASLAIIIRGIYRTVELAQGFHGYTNNHQPFIVLDAVPMVLCLAFLIPAHPYFGLRRVARAPPRSLKEKPILASESPSEA